MIDAVKSFGIQPKRTRSHCRQQSQRTPSRLVLVLKIIVIENDFSLVKGLVVLA
jgi:hypothetical protein